ncbi:VirB4 family type IV secretion/conjugal transfer ATPase [Ruegeria sp. EL01]|uniref:VirB4 family type IV secretion/conjugal transfer ATPase n=1 Tax=Ruegeria sp. EL01 TaxID=2107578 RepID=UPI000EA827C9|nr:VirB4 family type IV secretion/conjugal transfer ATPase [Ruegeria sp. EL01]
MGFERLLNRETAPDDYLPFVRHVDERTIITTDRSAFQMLKLDGASFRTADISGINALHDNLNHSIRNIADENVMIYSHIVRSDDQDYPAGEFQSGFAAWLDRIYRDQIQAKRLYRNDIYLTIFIKQGGLAGSKLATGLKRARKSQIEADAHLLDQLDNKAAQLAKSLKRFGARRLGLIRNDRDLLCSEPVSVLRMFLTGQYRLMPMVSGDIGSAIYTDRAVFVKDALEIRHPAETTFGAMFGFNEYPTPTRPNMLDDLLTAPFRFVLSQSFRFIARADAILSMKTKENKMRNAKDDGVSQADDLKDGRKHLMAGKFVMGEHNLSLLVFSDSVNAIRGNVAEANTLLANSGAIVAREDLGTESAFWTQLPGNHKHRLRAAPINSRNFTALSPLHNYPTGHRDGNHWGKAIAKLKTSADSPYYLNYHVADLGHTAIYGPSGSGKTVVLNFTLAQLEKLNVKRVLFDKDRGSEIFVRACGGSYLALHTGKPTGCAPFKALKMTPETETFFIALIKAMLADPQHPFTAQDNARIEAAVSGLRNVAQEQRSVSVLRELLGFGSGEADDIGNRLEKWCSEGRLSWVFENEADEIAFDADLVGFDMTSFLDDPDIRTPLMMYLMHRVEQLITGQRIALFIDEVWKALADAFFVGFVNDKLKVIRKENGIVIAGTQSTSDVLKSPIARTMIEQCATQIFFRNEKASERELVGEFGLSRREYLIIRNELNVGQFLIKQGGNSVVCELDLAGQDDALAVLSGRKEETALMNEIRAEHPDPSHWLPLFHARRKDLS